MDPRTEAGRQAILDRATAIVAERVPFYLRIRAMEAAQGYCVIAPGQAPWLPLADWNESSTFSIDRNEVRLVAILARRTGALRRLLAALPAHRLTPVVVAPIGPIMPAILKHYGWTSRVAGFGDTAEEQWRPR